MICPCCKREMPDRLMERHHLETRHKSEAVELICRECHQTIHGLLQNRELRSKSLNLNTLDGILNHGEFKKALSFIRKIPPGQSMRMKQAKHRKGRN